MERQKRGPSRLLSAVLAGAVGMMALTGVAGAQDGPSPGDAVDYPAQLDELKVDAENARAEILKEIARIDGWLADDDSIVIYQGGPDAEAISLTELGRDLSLHRLVEPVGLSLRQLRGLALVLDGSSDGAILDGLVAALDAGGRNEIMGQIRGSKWLSDAGLGAWRADLELELADIAELEDYIAAELRALAAAVPSTADESTAGSGSTAAAPGPFTDDNMLDLDSMPDDGPLLQGSVDVGGPFATCNWRTGWPQFGPLATMRIFAWVPTDVSPDASPRQFRYSVAWEPSRNDMLGVQRKEIERLLQEGAGEVIFVGGVNAFCAYVNSNCPGSLPRVCERLAAAT